MQWNIKMASTALLMLGALYHTSSHAMVKGRMLAG